MAVLNITPDSFYDGGKYHLLDLAIKRAKELERLGADIIDIGAESSRPFATPVNQEEELKRVIPVIEALAGKVSIPLSIDTYKPAVAKKALESGASIINDITGLQSDEMKKVARDFDCDIIVMHMQKKPKTMQQKPQYPNGVVEDLILFFEQRVMELRTFGIKDEKITLDPGIGFGKNVRDNISIILSIEKFKKMGFPLLIGASRKSFMGKILDKKPQDLLPATLAIHTMALMGGVDCLRVHDIEEHRDIIDLIQEINITRQ